MGNKQNITDSDMLNAGYRYALALTCNRQDAEDLVQGAWLRLYKRYGSTPDKPLFYRTIRNLFIDSVRHNGVASAYLDTLYLEQASSHSENTTSDLERELDSYNELAPHLAKLNDGERELLFLSVIEGYTADEIAAMTKKVRGTVLSNLHRSKQKLRNWIEKSSPSSANVIDFARRKGKL